MSIKITCFLTNVFNDLKKILEYPYPYEALALLRDHLTDFSLDKLTPIDYNKVVEWNRKASEDENDSSTV